MVDIGMGLKRERAGDGASGRGLLSSSICLPRSRSSPLHPLKRAIGGIRGDGVHERTNGLDERHPVSYLQVRPSVRRGRTGVTET